ncbi:hypothetical protein ACFCV3_41565 [Kribbella sp. NPDC056345]|uniref:hypothetical protein n=1 Tax=Kribbella sp. NPDC056345 TaxID=3345789 RepID=UPI0035D92616
MVGRAPASSRGTLAAARRAVPGVGTMPRSAAGVEPPSAAGADPADLRGVRVGGAAQLVDRGDRLVEGLRSAAPGAVGPGHTGRAAVAAARIRVGRQHPTAGRAAALGAHGPIITTARAAVNTSTLDVVRRPW